MLSSREMETLVRSAQTAMGKLIWMEAAELVVQERPGDEAAQVRLCDATFSAQEAQQQFESEQRLALERQGWVVQTPRMVVANGRGGPPSPR